MHRQDHCMVRTIHPLDQCGPTLSFLLHAKRNSNSVWRKKKGERASHGKRLMQWTNWYDNIYTLGKWIAVQGNMDTSYLLYGLYVPLSYCSTKVPLDHEHQMTKETETFAHQHEVTHFRYVPPGGYLIRGDKKYMISGAHKCLTWDSPFHVVWRAQILVNMGPYSWMRQIPAFVSRYLFSIPLSLYW